MVIMNKTPSPITIPVVCISFWAFYLL